MASLNNVQIIGNLGADPEVNTTDSGVFANISVATTEKWKDKNSGQQQERTEWHRVSFFGRQAEIVSEYLRKGSSIYVQGKLQTDKWTDKQGIERYTTKIIGRNMLMLGGRDSAPSQQNQPAQSSRAPAPEFDDGSVVPF